MSEKSRLKFLTTGRGLASLLTMFLFLMVFAVRTATFEEAHAAETAWIVKGGSARAQIVTAVAPPRMVDIAAKELQHYVLKLTGAEPPVVTEPTGEFPVKVYVGRSEHTDRLGVTDEGLKYGAFRMISGPDWLALVGRDFDFEPVKPWPSHHREREQANLDWDEITGHTWRNPMHALHRDHNSNFGVWKHDEGGSLNAVCEFLRALGVRWYLPGEIGEVVPARKSIALPDVDKTVRPSFALRKLKWSNYNIDWDDMMWDRRMGLNSGYELWGAKSYKSHGMRAVIGRREMQEAHPEYFALLGGSRDTEKGGTGTPCLRSPGLIRETVAFVRASFDHYDEPMVCIWPTDGFRQCRCELCKDTDNVSDYVWGFVETVAAEVFKTYPDRKVSCGAYSSYVDPPEDIEKFSPNVVVYIANRGRPAFGAPESWERHWNTIEAWREKVAPGNLLRGENNLYTFRHGGRTGPVAFPALHPREIAKDLRALQGVSLGERNESPRGIRRGDKNNTWAAPGVDHLNLYVNSRFLWDADQDIEAMLDEYYTLFYGPARLQMQAALEFADENFPASPDASRGGWLPPLDVRAQFVNMLHDAREAAGDTVYGERVQLILDELPSLDGLRVAGELAVRRGEDVIIYDRLVDFHNDKWRDDRVTFHPDGRLDEAFWQCYPHGRNLRAADGGGAPLRTTVMARWYRNHIYFGIHCEGDTDEPLNIPATRDGDPAILEGDWIEILIETGPENFYRIAVNPAGAVVDMDMTAEGDGTAWSSNADVGVHVDDDYWSVEVRLPVVSEGTAGMDHLNAMPGRMPTRAWPWHFNVARFSMQEDESQVMTYSPLNGSDLTDRATFALLVHMGDARRMLQARR